MEKTEFLRALADALSSAGAEPEISKEQIALFEHFFSAADPKETDSLLSNEESAINIINEIAYRAAKRPSASKEETEAFREEEDVSDGYGGSQSLSEDESRGDGIAFDSELSDTEEMTERYSIENSEAMLLEDEELNLQDDSDFPLLDFEELEYDSENGAVDGIPSPDSDIFDEILHDTENFDYIEDELASTIVPPSKEELQESQSDTEEDIPEDDTEEEDDVLEYRPSKKEERPQVIYKATPKYWAVFSASLPITLPLFVAALILFALGFAAVFAIAVVAASAIILTAALGIVMTIASLASAFAAFSSGIWTGIFELGIGIVCIGIAVLLVALCFMFIFNVPTFTKALARLFMTFIEKTRGLANKVKGVFDR